MRTKINCLLFLFILFGCSSSDDAARIGLGEEIQKSAPVLKEFGFLASDNPQVLIQDVKGEIIGDSIIECWIPHLVTNKQLKPTISYDGNSIMIDSVAVSGGGQI